MFGEIEVDRVASPDPAPLGDDHEQRHPDPTAKTMWKARDIAIWDRAATRSLTRGSVPARLRAAGFAWCPAMRSRFIARPRERNPTPQSHEGKIRHVGVSNFSADQMAEFARTRPVETNQVPYSLFRRSIEADVLPYAREHQIGVLAYGPLAHGLLTGGVDEHTTFEPGDWRSGNPSFAGETFHRNLETVRKLQRFAAEELDSSVSQLAVAWTLANPAVQVAIVGARRTRHIEEAVAATELQLDEHELEHVDRIMAGAMAFSGPAPEMMPTR